jgi:hypothetical protein
MMAFFLVTLTAFIAGVMNAIAGGGTFLTFPALTYFGGLDQKVANITSTIGLWPGSASSVAAASRDFARIPRGMMVSFSIISLIGGGAGSILLLTTSTHSFELVIPWLLAFATIIFGFSKPIARWAGRHQGHRTLGWTLIVAFIQIFVATYGGYFGAGIGVLMLAGLSFAGLDDIHQMNALKVLLSTLINAVAAIFFILFSSVPLAERMLVRINSHANIARINWRIAAAMAAASIIGGFWGMAVARKVKPDLLRAVILVIGIGLTGFYFAQNYFHVF